MDLFNKALNGIVQKAEIKKSGKFNGIPYPFPRFAQYIPSIDPEQVIGLTSYSGAAKSKFSRYAFIMHPYEFSRINDYPLEIDYYALEDSAEKVFKSILCHYLYAQHKEKVSLYDLDSKFRELPPKIVKLIKEGEKYLQEFNDKVHIKDSFTSPAAIKRDIVQRAKQIGEVTEEGFEYNGVTTRKIVAFNKKQPTHWLMLLDNLNNVDKNDYHKDPKNAMDDFVNKDCRLLYSKIFKMTCVIIHQQSLEAEKPQFTNAGGMILEKIKPSAANLGGTKEVVRSYHLLLSLFDPSRFKNINDYRGYDIKRIGNYFRELEVLKTNDGVGNISTPLFFDGAAEYFRELPNSEKQKEELDKFYNWLQEEQNRKLNKNLLF